jgi:hypothetical protein
MTVGAVGTNTAVASTNTSTSSFSQSVLAERLAPPQLMRTNWLLPTILVGAILSPFGAWFGGMLIGAILSKLGFSDNVAFPVALCLGASLPFIYLFRENRKRGASAKKYNKEVYPGALEAWRKQFYCHRCDSVFAVQ